MIYLTKYMIADYLEEHGIPVKICGKEPWKFFDTNYYINADIQPEILYFANTTALVQAPRGICLLRVLADDLYVSYHSEHEEIICSGNLDDVHKILQDCFNFYKNWYLKLQEIIIKGGDLQALIDRSTAIFKNPIAVSDIGFQVLAYTREYHALMEDDESRFIVKNGCHSPAYICLITKQTAFIKNLKGNLGPFRYHYDFLDHESVYCTIWLHGKPAGFLTIVGMHPLLKKSTIDAACIFAEILSKAFDLDSANHPYSSPSDHILLQFLKGHEVDEKVVENALTLSGIYSDRPYQIIYLQMSIIKLRQNMLFKKVYSSLTNTLKQSKILPDKDGIAIILSLKNTPCQQLIQLIELLLPAYPYQIGISYPFRGLQKLDIFYRQAHVCLQQKETQSEQRLFRYEHFMITDVLGNSLTSIQKATAIHPALFLLMNWDAKNDSELFHSLRVYLDTNCNGTIAAEKLHIHKNTLYYRLKQMEDIAPLDFDNPCICDCLRISYYLSELGWA